MVPVGVTKRINLQHRRNRGMPPKPMTLEVVPVKDDDHYWSVNILNKRGETIFVGKTKYSTAGSCEDFMIRMPFATFEVDLVPIKDRKSARRDHYKGGVI